jgi:hypothetical protein
LGFESLLLKFYATPVRFARHGDGHIYLGNMNKPSIVEQSLVDAWIKIQYSGAESKEADELWWAWDTVFEWSCEKPDQTFLFVLAVLNTDSSTKIMQNLSAGPLEDLLSNFGMQIIDAIEVEAKSNPKFASLLGGVWKSSMADEVWARVQSVWDQRGWDGIPEESA